MLDYQHFPFRQQMNYFEDCDLILKIHYNHYFQDLYSKTGEPRWHHLDTFEKLCQDNLMSSEYGYIQAVHFQLTSDGYLQPIGELNDLTKKRHVITSKGFAFILNGAYKGQVKAEEEKLRHSKISATGTYYGWIVALIFGILSSLSGFYDKEKNNEISDLKKELSRIQSKVEADTVKSQKRLFQLRILEKNVDTGQQATKISRN